jgi:hypothetical protein
MPKNFRVFENILTVIQTFWYFTGVNDTGRAKGIIVG